ncbi:uncharacterized protein F54H12.2-like [Pleurodeles waltl]|uniref:uncharacterized protein F54H12.2-like n=1 Tax=Pleurodeles waltl TaxID=8319 RepID=UPI0037094119
MYLNLNSTLLHLVCKILKANGTNIEADAKVVPIAYPIATMFNQVDINLGDRFITQSDNMYAYKAYIKGILNYSRKALDIQPSVGLFYKDTQAHFEDTALGGGNNGFKKRPTFVTSSRQFDLLGRIHSDLFLQDKLLVSSIDLKIKLSLNKDTFCLISGNAELYKLVILSVSLLVKIVKVSLSVTLAHAEALQLANAKYAIERVALKMVSIPAGNRLTQQQNIFLGQLLKLIIIGFVDNTAFSRLYTSNPFNFKHYDISYAALVHERAVIPAKPSTPSFGTYNFVREYLGQVSITGTHLCDSGVVVSREGYGATYTLFVFNLTPDLQDNDHYNLIKNGNRKAEIRFKQALASNVNMVVFSVFDSVIQVNHTDRLCLTIIKRL